MMADTKNTNVVVPLLPLHLSGDRARARGRPQKVEPRPSQSDLDYHAAILEERRDFVAEHPLVHAVEERNPQKVLEETAAALAAEAASLEHLRGEVEKRGRDFSMISSRRSAILCELTKTQIKIRDLDPQVLDLSSEQMTRLFRYWIETIRDVALDVLPAEQFDIFFNALENRLQDWEAEAEARLR